MAITQKHLETQLNSISNRVNNIEEEVAALLASLALVSPVPSAQRSTLKNAAHEILRAQKASTTHQDAIDRLLKLQRHFHPRMRRHSSLPIVVLLSFGLGVGAGALTIREIRDYATQKLAGSIVKLAQAATNEQQEGHNAASGSRETSNHLGLHPPAPVIPKDEVAYTAHADTPTPAPTAPQLPPPPARVNLGLDVGVANVVLPAGEKGAFFYVKNTGPGPTNILDLMVNDREDCSTLQPHTIYFDELSKRYKPDMFHKLWVINPEPTYRQGGKFEQGTATLFAGDRAAWWSACGFLRVTVTTDKGAQTYSLR